MNSLKASVCCAVLCGAAVAALREKVATEIDFGRFKIEFVRVLSSAGSGGR